MLNEPPQGERRPHPLERRPVSPHEPPPEGEPQPPRQRVMLHFPAVSPQVTYTLIAINVLIFVVRALSPVWDERIFEWGANIPTAVLQEGSYHRLLTSMFLHASIYGIRDQLALSNSLHIILNMYVLYALGTQLEPLFGHRRFLLIYLLGGLAGSIFSTVFSGPNIASVGASGAVFAIIGAELIYLYQHRKLLGERGRAQMRSVIIWAGINFAYGALNSVLAAGIRIDNWAHLGGFLGGMALTWFIGPIFLPRQHPEVPGALIAEDANPLHKRYWVLSAYVSALLILLIAGATLARG